MTSQSANEIESLEGIRKHVVLAPFTTMKVGGPARYFLSVESSQQLKLAVDAARLSKTPYVILGGGSNTLVSDQGFAGFVIKANGGNHAMSGTKLSADSTCILASVSRVAYQHGLSGLEWGVGVPGTVGGAVRGNAGNFLGDLRRNIYAVEFLDELGEEKTFSNEECKFEYRQSIFKTKPELIVLRAHFALTRDSSDAIKERMDEILNYKRETQSTPYPTSGCMFKNVRVMSPNDRANAEEHHIADLIRFSEDVGGDVIPVRALLERLGLRAFRVGGAMVSERNANFILNVDHATAEHIMTLVGTIKQKVYQSFKIELHEEFQYIGFNHSLH